MANGQPKGVKYGGRAKGTPNKRTVVAREAIARLVDGNAERMQEWLDQIAEEHGAKAAWDCLVDVLEFHVPKLGRTEHALSPAAKEVLLKIG